MHLNNLSPAVGSRKNKLRHGRGIGSGLGKTSGRGHKGQTSRTGGFRKVGFEGGQMPIQRRLPKVGFVSMLSLVTAEIRLHELNSLVNKFDISEIDIDVLKHYNLIPKKIERAKIILSGEINKSITIKGLSITAGARSAIENAGGKIEDNVEANKVED